ncbi:hypothetical protein [Pseudorhodoplanes sinuspersici]|uniref:Uncharacterized protein n=1 Tax=Pseudorhodoplanes sinuspersici TaxID=1235591 RepID=A0A1W6ZXG0_9HYPH|nr:hypothetical protein [Pseudorhodoplanes sinuspersici]ARQ02006.1 hypothetical protein CAK95_25075 [Pseudorhodoplanes sinuspersici]
MKRKEAAAAYADELRRLARRAFLEAMRPENLALADLFRAMGREYLAKAERLSRICNGSADGD